MLRGPQGWKRPADAIGWAVMVAKITTGEIEEELKQPARKARSGRAGAREQVRQRGAVGHHQKGGGGQVGLT